MGNPMDTIETSSILIKRIPPYSRPDRHYAYVDKDSGRTIKRVVFYVDTSRGVRSIFARGGNRTQKNA